MPAAENRRRQGAGGGPLSDAVRRLLIRPGAVGDCILALPAMESLCAAYTEVWVTEQNVPLIRFADRVRSLGSSGIDWIGIEGVAPPASVLDRLMEFDSIISWYGFRRPEFRAALEGLPVRFFPALPPPDWKQHAVEFFLTHAAECGGRPVDPVPRLPCPVITNAGMAVIHPFSGSSKKNWPLERFRQLAQYLSRRLPVQWCAGPEEKLEGAVRMEDLFELACWLKSARLYVGNDSGITHLAAAAGVPTVAIFGPTDPAVWGPRGPHVRVVYAGGAPVDQVAFSSVVKAVESLL